MSGNYTCENDNPNKEPGINEQNNKVCVQEIEPMVNKQDTTKPYIKIIFQG